MNTDAIFSALFRLNRRDLINGLFVAVAVVALGALQQGVADHGIDFAAYDWVSILDVAVKAAGAYLLKNLATASNGKLGGVL